MNVIKSIGIVLVLCMGLAFGSEAQTVRFGIYIAPSLTAPIQGPNTFIVRDYVPRAGVDVCGLVDIEVREKWKFRTGLGITSFGYRENIGFFVFEDQISPVYGRAESTKQTYLGMNVPLFIAYRKPDAITGFIGGLDVLLPIYNKLEWQYPGATTTESKFAVSVIPAVNLGIQMSFPVGSDDSRLEIEPVGKLYLGKLQYNDHNLFSLGLRLVYIK